MRNRFGPAGFYVLDEPESALSAARQLAMLERLHQLVLQGSQFIIATHSPILLAYPDSKILQVGERGLAEVAYRDTDSFRTTRNFLNNYEAAIKIIISE